MSTEEIIRSWKQVLWGKKEEPEQGSQQAPISPIGVQELSDEELANVAGGDTSVTFYPPCSCSAGSCAEKPF